MNVRVPIQSRVGLRRVFITLRCFLNCVRVPIQSRVGFPAQVTLRLLRRQVSLNSGTAQRQAIAIQLCRRLFKLSGVQSRMSERNWANRDSGTEPKGAPLRLLRRQVSLKSGTAQRQAIAIQLCRRLTKPPSTKQLTRSGSPAHQRRNP